MVQSQTELKATDDRWVIRLDLKWHLINAAVFTAKVKLEYMQMNNAAQ